MGEVDGDDELEFTLFNKRDVLVYQIPPSSSSTGHKADEWKKCIWRGRCRMVGKGKELTIMMLDASNGQLFAQCVIPNGDHDKFVERAVDSSRYFVLKVTNGQRHAFIGLGFEDRNDAFDFNCCLSDFKTTYVDRDRDKSGEHKIQEPAKDLSLKEGQKIVVNLRGIGGGGDHQKRRGTTPQTGSGFGGVVAPPPPSAGRSRRQQPAVGLGGPPDISDHLFDTSSTASTTVVPQPAPPAPAVSAPDDFFHDFADFQSAAAATSKANVTRPVEKSSIEFDSGLGQFNSTPARKPVAYAQESSVTELFDPFAGLSSTPTKIERPASQNTAHGRDPFDIFA